MAACEFCDLVAAGDDLVHAGEHAAAFLDRRPLFKGHLLVVPRRHLVTLDQVPPELLAPLMLAVQAAMRALTRELGAVGTFVAANNRISQSVPHLHLHVVPRQPKDGLRGFFWPRTTYEDEAERVAYRDRLHAAMALELPRAHR